MSTNSNPNKALGACERCPGSARHKTARNPLAALPALDNHGLPPHRCERFAETGHPQLYPIGVAQVEHDHVVFPVVNQLVQGRDQLDLPAARQPALEDRELQP
jgi:hypothetical protein